MFSQRSMKNGLPIFYQELHSHFHKNLIIRTMRLDFNKNEGGPTQNNIGPLYHYNVVILTFSL